jgi:hypothetical protein
VIWGGPIVDTLLLVGFIDGFVDVVNKGFEDGVRVGDEGGLAQPSNIASRGNVKAKIRKNLKNFICPAKRYISTERIKDTILLLWIEYPPKFNAF